MSAVIKVGTDKITPIFDRNDDGWYCKVTDKYNAEIYSTGSYSDKDQAINEARTWIEENE